jgi:hypothetical protein
MAALVLTCAAYGSQPPWERPPESWSTDDIKIILTQSPWSIQTAAEMDDPRDVREPQPAGPPDTGGTGGTNLARAKAPWDGEVGKNRMGHLATVPVVVRWDSALPIRQAQKEAAAPTTEFVLSLAGLIPAGRYHAIAKQETTSSSDGAVDRHNPEEVLEAFMAYSKISVKGSPDVHPVNVKLDAATGTVRIFFPRQPDIEQSQKDIVFTTTFGGLKVNAKFRASRMKYHGTLEL